MSKQLLVQEIEQYIPLDDICGIIYHYTGDKIKIYCSCCKKLQKYTDFSNNQKKKSYKKMRCNECVNVYRCKNECNIVLHSTILKTFDIISIIYEYCGNTTNFIRKNVWYGKERKLYTIQCCSCQKYKYIDEYSKHQCKDRTRGLDPTCKKCVYQFNRFPYYFKKNKFQKLKKHPLETVFFDRFIKQCAQCNKIAKKKCSA